MRRALVLALALLAALPAAASAHAELEGTVPQSGAMLEHAPRQVVFRFGETVEARFGALRVYDAHGRQVQEGSAFHPGGHGDEVAIRLPSGLRGGGYTATYRVISADSHPVEGGITFMVGHGMGAAPSVAGLLAGQSSGPVTGTAFSVVRALQFAAIAIGLGALVFLLLCWLPALRLVSGAAGDWRAASAAFAARLRAMLAAAAAVGALSAVVGVVLEGAVGEGTSFWHAARWDVVRDVLSTRFGTVWGLAVVAWVLVLGTTALARQPVPALRPASLGATGLALPAGGARLAALAVPLAALALLPALGGHGSLQDPVAIMFPANVLHVLAMSAWMGGVGILVLGLRGATARLEPPDRTRLLAATVGRFSQLAGVAVAVLLATGVAQGLVEVRTVPHLVDTAFGRAVLIKLILFSGLIAIGAVNRRRLVPGLRRAAAGGASPGATGAMLRRTLRAELALGVTVLGVTGALAGYPPSIDAAAGPYSTGANLGPARLEATVDPARVGPNVIHMYLFDRRTGRQYRAVKEMHVTASLPGKGIAPIPLHAHPAGPGHYQIDGAALAPAGKWTVALTARVSAFDEYTTRLTVPIR